MTPNDLPANGAPCITTAEAHDVVHGLYPDGIASRSELRGAKRRMHQFAGVASATDDPVTKQSAIRIIRALQTLMNA